MNVNGAHGSGGTIGALIGYLASRYNWHVSQDEALAWGALFASVGITVAHMFTAAWTGIGLWPSLKRGWLGPTKPTLKGRRSGS